MTGCPDVISVALANISNLASELSSVSAAGTSKHILAPAYESRAKSIWLMIASFSPSIPPSLRGTSLYNSTRVAIQELWRQTAQIHYYQAIYQRRPSDPALQACLAQVFGLCDIIDFGLPGLLYGPLALPIFLAGTIAIEPNQQKRIRQRLSALYEAAAFRDMHHFIERLWAESADTIELADWRRAAKSLDAGALSFL
jgi:hypothetical protein